MLKQVEEQAEATQDHTIPFKNMAQGTLGTATGPHLFSVQSNFQYCLTLCTLPLGQPYPNHNKYFLFSPFIK